MPANPSTITDRAKPSRTDVPRTTTRYPSGRVRLGGRDCDRAHRLLLLTCRNLDLHRKRIIDYATWERRDIELVRASRAADAAWRQSLRPATKQEAELLAARIARTPLVPAHLRGPGGAA